MASGTDRPHRTHVVENQSPPRVDVDEFATNVPLVEAVVRYDAGGSVPALAGIGRLVGGAEFQDDAVRANTNDPVLRAFDRWGNRIDEVDYDPAYHTIIAAAVAAGAHTSAWADPGPGANVVRAATFFLFAQVEPGHACPVSMSHAAVPTLSVQPDLAATWVPRLLSRDYDPQLGSGGKTSALVGMAMTEKQGGSDVRANRTVAVPVDGRGAGYGLPAHGPQVVLLGADVGRVLRARPGGRGRRGGAVVLPRAARAPGREPERLPYPAAQGQAGQPRERLE